MPGVLDSWTFSSEASLSSLAERLSGCSLVSPAHLEPSSLPVGVQEPEA